MALVIVFHPFVLIIVILKCIYVINCLPSFLWHATSHEWLAIKMKHRELNCVVLETISKSLTCNWACEREILLK